jgi:hypothetical protein
MNQPINSGWTLVQPASQTGAVPNRLIADLDEEFNRIMDAFEHGPRDDIDVDEFDEDSDDDMSMSDEEAAEEPVADEADDELHENDVDDDSDDAMSVYDEQADQP